MKNNSIKLARPLLILALLALMAMTVASIGASADETGDVSAPTVKGKSYIVLMEGAPLAAYEGDVKGMPATKPAKGEKVNPNSNAAKKYDAYLRKNQNKAMRDAGVPKRHQTNAYTVALNGFSAVMTEAQVKEMAGLEGVQLVMKDQWRQPMTDSSGDFLGLTGPAGAWQTGYDGEGVVVGVIDSGIWPEHPSFADDGSYPEPPVTLDDSRPNCEFGNTDHNENDVPFECNNKLIGARQMLDTYRFFIGALPDEFDSARDDSGHGTHTASTAAGNAGVAANIYGIPRGDISGVAPRAHVIAYKGLGFLGGFTSDLASAIDQAVADGVDVINYSVGGGANLPGADEVAFLFADAAGVFVATSAGNAGPGPATLGNPGTMPWMTTVGANTQSRFFQGTIVLGDGSEYIGASITPGTGGEYPLVDAEFASIGGEDRCLPGSLIPEEVAGKIVLCRRGASARVVKSQTVLEAGGVGTIMYNNSDVDNLATDTHWTSAVHIDQTPGLAIKAYIATAGEAATAEIFGEQVSEWPYAPSMTIFSSRGPNPVAPDIIKPDITAPGTQILAGYTPMPSDEIDVPGELFYAIQGTSMSSPEIAGVFALIKQANPDWSPAMAKSAIMTTAYQDVVDNDRMSPTDPFDFGAGHVNPGNAVHKGSAFQPGLAYHAGLFEYVGFTCGMDWGTFTPGSCDFVESEGVPMEPWNLNVPSIGIGAVPGTQTVMRTVTSVAQENGWRDYSVSVEAPEGYSVTVEPSSFSLKRGMSATYYVTVTNESAPIGEWRFGSLTWSDKTGNYEVYSPIAVRGALFSAPAEVTGSGESGSASFDVTFGYTGDYEAAGHGLDAQTVTSDFIGQDPDQTYPSPDDAPPGVLKYDFPIAGAAYARWELILPGDDDIDLFLEDSSGNIIAQSTSGGTDELIELWLPADDIYTMVVHGWSIPNEPLAFDMYSWVVPLATGGSLSVDSAPATAVQGEVGTIDISWTGAAPGTNYGLVSHTGPSGLMGFTVIKVES
jgi:subtilisin family serine protease